MNNILCPTFVKLSEEETLSLFQQGSATVHMAAASLKALQMVFGDHIINRGL
jgi:hypothetical protein